MDHDDNNDEPPFATPPVEGRRTVEDWASLKKVDPHVLAGVRVGEQWPEGQELTEEQFDEAITRAAQIVLR